ncbi:hypothetical protein BH11ARM1_BH11ARM1_04090 [soil metagenome]
MLWGQSMRTYNRGMTPLILLATIALAGSNHPASSVPSFAVLQKIPIGGDGGWDYLTMDSDSHRLFISRGSHVMVLDVKTGKIVGDIPDTSGVHGIAIAAKAGKGYTSNGRDNSVTVFDLKTYATLKTIKVGDRPDAIAFDPVSQRVFTFNGGSSDTTVIGVADDTVVGTVKLDGKPEFAWADGKGNLCLNVEDKSEMQRIDTKTLKVVSTWSVSPGEEPSGLGIDARNGLAFSVCSNELMAITDFRSGKVVGTATIGKDADGAAFDPALNLAFSSNGQDGTLTVVGKGADGKWAALQTLATQVSARTIAIDAKTHRVYVIAASFEAQTDPNSRRRQMVPGSAVILEIGTK